MAQSPKSRAAAKTVKPSKKPGLAVDKSKAAAPRAPKVAGKAKLSSPKAAPDKTTPAKGTSSKPTPSKTARAKVAPSKLAVAAKSNFLKKPSPPQGQSPVVEKARTPAKIGAPAKAKTKSEAKTASKAGTGSKGRKVGRKAPAAEPRTTKPGAKAPPLYLAAELGQPVDHEGEPIGASAASARSDRDLQDYALQLWRQMQSGRGVSRYIQKIERAGLTMDDLWESAMAAPLHPTSSTADDLRRYKQKALFRANLLEAILSETLADLRRLDTIAPAETTSERG